MRHLLTCRDLFVSRHARTLQRLTLLFDARRRFRYTICQPRPPYQPVHLPCVGGGGSDMTSPFRSLSVQSSPCPCSNIVVAGTVVCVMYDWTARDKGGAPVSDHSQPLAVDVLHSPWQQNVNRALLYKDRSLSVLGDHEVRATKSHLSSLIADGALLFLLLGVLSQSRSPCKRTGFPSTASSLTKRLSSSRRSL